MHRPFANCSAPFALALVVGHAAVTGCAAEGAESGGGKSPDDAAHPLLGNKGPDFTRKIETGSGTISLHSLSGKVAVVDFWATWCEPCKKSFPKLEELSVKYKDGGLEIVGISEDDDKAGIPSFASGLGTRFPLIWDEDKSIASKWQPKSMPTTFIVDRKGTVRFVHLGYHDGEEADIEREVKGLL